MHPKNHTPAIEMVLSLALLASASAGAQTATAPPAATPVEVTHPAPGSVNRWITLPGSIKPLQEATLYAKVPGYLKSINVDKGDSVKAGATLAVLETPELSADLSGYRAQVEAARLEYDRMQQATKQAPDLVMPVELDRAKGKFEVARAGLERTQSLLGFNRITAPFAGVITRRFVDPGAFIPAATAGIGAQTAAVVTLMNFDTVRVQFAVPENEASLVHKGQAVRLTVEGLPNRSFEGKLTRFAYALDENTRTMLAELELPNPKRELRPGMYASVQLALEQHDNVLLIPAAALVMEKTNAFAYVAAGDLAKKRPLKVGFNDGAKVEVLEGLASSDSVILVGKRAFTDGQPIQPTQAK
jgi:membrane fusion protein (multidrug efflux system)